MGILGHRSQNELGFVATVRTDCLCPGGAPPTVGDRLFSHMAGSPMALLPGSPLRQQSLPVSAPIQMPAPPGIAIQSSEDKAFKASGFSSAPDGSWRPAPGSAPSPSVPGPALPATPGYPVGQGLTSSTPPTGDRGAEAVSAEPISDRSGSPLSQRLEASEKLLASLR